MALNLARQFPAGIQLLNTLLPTDSTNAASLSSIAGLVDGALLFVWNGSDVNGVVIPDDVFIEPVVLEIQTQRLDKLGSPYQVVQTGCEGNGEKNRHCFYYLSLVNKSGVSPFISFLITYFPIS